MKPDEFIKVIAQAAIASMGKYKIPASFTVSEAALESGWGSSLLARAAKNLFGVKADKSWNGDILTMRTREFIKGQWVIVQAKWRKYPDWMGCLEDHAQFLLTNPRYEQCFTGNLSGEDFAHAVAQAGYATDPDYAKKLIATMHSHNLTLLDKA